MPLVNIHLIEGKGEQYLQGLSKVIHCSLMDAWGIPEDDKFHIIHEHKKNNFLINRNIWNADRSDDVIVLHITTSPRTTEMKINFYELLANSLHDKLQLKKDDIFINVTTTEKEDWSFGFGMAQLVE